MKDLSIITYFTGVIILGISIGNIYTAPYGFIFIGGGCVIFSAAIAIGEFLRPT